MSYFFVFSLFFCLFSVFPGIMEASLFTIGQTLVTPNSIIYQTEGVYSESQSPSGNGVSEIAWDLLVNTIPNNNFSIYNASQFLTAEVVLVHSSQDNNIFNTPDYGYQYCCTDDLYIEYQCNEVDRLILGNISVDPASNGYTMYYYPTLVVNNSVQISQSVQPLVSGIWYLIIANCDLDGERNFIASGNTIWRSPFGYLPAQDYGDLIVYWILAFMYLIGLGMWLALMLKYRKDLQKYQHGVTALIIVSFLEELLSGITYLNYNTFGYLNMGLSVVSIIFSAGKLTGIRFLLLLMALGYAITVATIPLITQILMLILSLCYFATVVGDAYVAQSLTDTADNSSIFTTTALLVVLNTIFIVWIIWSTLVSMKKTKIEKNQKYSMYRNLLIIFGVICLICIIAFFTVVAVNFAGVEDIAYQWYWLLDTYWDFIYYGINVYIAYVWRPADDNQRYAYSALQENVDNDQVELDESVKSSVGGDTEREV